MGDLRDWSTESNGGLAEERSVPLRPSSPSSNPNPASISAERWRIAEEATEWIICQVQPTAVSEDRRIRVIEYVQRLIRGYLGCEIFPFGSVPLKTYLPDGDIDLTAFGNPNVEDALANDVFSVLDGEDQNNDGEFIVKDVKIINAEVKLVKCLVQNIVVDISFNQLGGLCTLCFLEQVDCLIGKDHLFKRSILLIKAWCYYESRILGAHHGLFSTYALETLVLYIFHIFHSSLNGPLAVLYRFLDYFCKFDWDNYCISVNGPVRISSLPEIVAERPDNGGLGLLFSNEFLRECVDMFSVPSRGHEMNSRTFVQKHLNIVDTLKENNNLGRSISKGNSYRIRSAFTYGARKLGQILLRREENVSDELRKFFMNTLDRHESIQRPDVQDLLPISNFKGYTVGSVEPYQEDKTLSILTTADSNSQIGESRLGSVELLQNRVVDGRIPGTEMIINSTANGLQKGSMEGLSSKDFSEGDNFAYRPAASGNRFSGDTKDLALRISDDTIKYSPPGGEGISLVGEAQHDPHLYFSHLKMEHPKIHNGNPDKKQAKISDDVNNNAFSGQLQFPDKNHHVSNELLTSIVSIDNDAILSLVACSFKDFCPGHSERGPGGTNGSPEALKTSSDLNGNYEAHFHSLQYGRWCCEYFSTAPIPPPPLPLQLPPQFQAKFPWNSFQRAPQSRQVSYSQLNANGFVPRPRPPFSPINTPISPSSAFGVEELPKPRGTGTYFPNMNHQLNRVQRISLARGRNHVPLRSPHRNNQAVTPLGGNLFDGSIHEVPQTHASAQQGAGNLGFPEFNHHSGSPGRKELSNSNGALVPPEKVIEYGSYGHLQSRAPLAGSIWNPSTSVMANSTSLISPLSPGLQRKKSVLATNDDRNDDRVIRSYQLKDEDDFPPLSS